VVGFIIIALSLIVCRVCQWKNFENQSIIGKDMDKSKVARFLAHSVYVIISKYSKVSSIGNVSDTVPCSDDKLALPVLSFDMTCSCAPSYAACALFNRDFWPFVLNLLLLLSWGMAVLVLGFLRFSVFNLRSPYRQRDGEAKLVMQPIEYITNSKVNSAFHPSGVGKLSIGLSG